MIQVRAEMKQIPVTGKNKIKPNIKPLQSSFTVASALYIGLGLFPQDVHAYIPQQQQPPPLERIVKLEQDDIPSTLINIGKNAHPSVAYGLSSIIDQIEDQVTEVQELIVANNDVNVDINTKLSAIEDELNVVKNIVKD